jgi:phosphoribosyl-AMP cyclohydrolase
MKKGLLFVIAVLAVLSACKKDEFDIPPIKTLPLGSVISVSELKEKFQGTNVKFNEDLSVYAVVTMDERSGNLYKNVYVQDNESAINLRLVSAGGLYQGDSIRIYLKGTILGKFNGMFQLDSVDVDKNIVKQKTKVNIEPQTVSVQQINSSLQSKLVRLENVQFKNSELGLTYANVLNQTTANRTIEDCNGNSIIVRTSGYAKFAGDTIPSKNGSLTAVVGEFNGTMQLFLRETSDVKFLDGRCGGDPNSGNCTVQSVDEKFDGISDNTDVAIDCWNNIAEKGSRKWRGRVFNNEKYIQANAFNSTDAENVCWIVSPSVNYTSSLKLSFETAKSFYTHNGLSVWISTNFNGTNTTAATWTNITAVIAGASNADNSWVSSGIINLSGYIPQGYSGNIHIGFKYEGNASASQTGTFRIDNVKIFN